MADDLTLLNPTQTVFALFYAIIWGVIGNVQPRWKAFDWARTYERPVRNRVWLSFLCFNVAPIGFFLIFLYAFSSPFWKLTTANPIEFFLKVGPGIIPPFAIFGFYRVWLSIIERWPETFYWWAPIGFVPYADANEPIELETDGHLRKIHSFRNLRCGLLYIGFAIGLPSAVLFWGTNMSLRADWLNLTGLLVNFAGTLLLLVYSQKLFSAAGTMVTQSWEREFAKEFRNVMRWFRFGITLLVTGFLLQLIGAVVGVYYQQ